MNTLDKWIARERIRVAPTRNGRPPVALEPLVALAAEVVCLRGTGKTEGVPAAAILALQLDDPTYRQGFDNPVKTGLKAIRRGDLVHAAIPDTFGPDDRRPAFIAEAFEVVVPRAVHREMETLAGKGAGYAEDRRRLGVDSCNHLFDVENNRPITSSHRAPMAANRVQRSHELEAFLETLLRKQRGS